MESFLDGTNTQLYAYFEALDLEVDDARAFFRLLDVDGSGHIDIDEFCDGCMKLKGEARSFDLNCMIYEARAMVRTWSEFMYFVEQEFISMRAECHSIAKNATVPRRFLEGHFAGTAVHAESRDTGRVMGSAVAVGSDTNPKHGDCAPRS